MLEAAERDGKLKPGGTIVEPTSGTRASGSRSRRREGLSLHLRDARQDEPGEDLDAARVRREVVITPTAVEPDSPESYYSVSSRLAEEIPAASSPTSTRTWPNPQAHYEVTGPEIFEQTGGELDAIVISVGTGGTISGVGRYFKEHAPNV
jgi:cystathionine beta-synthase